LSAAAVSLAAADDISGDFRFFLCWGMEGNFFFLYRKEGEAMVICEGVYKLGYYICELGHDYKAHGLKS
jgi:hypothetical protein